MDKQTTIPDASRSDRVRARRRKRTRSGGFFGRFKRSRPVRGSAQNVPVLVRHGKTEMPLEPRRRMRTRRRFDIAMGAPGAEIRLPTLPSLRLSLRFVSGALAAILLALLYNLWNGPAYRVQAAQIGGLERVSVTQVAQVLELQDQPIFGLDQASLQSKLLQAFPEFAQVEINVELPNVLMIEVRERQPVLLWRTDAGSVLVDAQGVAFLARDADADLPVVQAQAFPEMLVSDGAALETAAIPAPFLTAETISAILALNQIRPEEAVISYDTHHGLGWQDPRGWQVYFGRDLADYRQKIRVYRGLVQHLREEGIRPSLISVEYLHAPFYRLER